MENIQIKKERNRLVILLIIGTLLLSSMFLQNVNAVGIDWETPSQSNPYIVSLASWSQSVTCAISAVKNTIIVAVFMDLQGGGSDTHTFSDSLTNTYTTPSTNDNTAGIKADSNSQNYGYWIGFANANSNGSDTITADGTSPTGEYAMKCYDVANLNSTGWYTLPTLPIIVWSTYNDSNGKQLMLKTPINDYSSGLAISLSEYWVNAQGVENQVAPTVPFESACFAGAPAACDTLELDAGGASWNFRDAHSIGGENTNNEYVSQNDFNGWDILISIPSANSCIPSNTNSCQEGWTPSINTPNNFDYATYISLSVIPIIYIILPTLLLGFIGLYFGAGIYGYVFGSIIGALIGLVSGSLNIWIFLCTLYGAIALFYISNGNSSSIGDDEGDYDSL